MVRRKCERALSRAAASPGGWLMTILGAALSAGAIYLGGQAVFWWTASSSLAAGTALLIATVSGRLVVGPCLDGFKLFVRAGRDLAVAHFDRRDQSLMTRYGPVFNAHDPNLPDIVGRLNQVRAWDRELRVAHAARESVTDSHARALRYWGIDTMPDAHRDLVDRGTRAAASATRLIGDAESTGLLSYHPASDGGDADRSCRLGASWDEVEGIDPRLIRVRVESLVSELDVVIELLRSQVDELGPIPSDRSIGPDPATDPIRRLRRAAEGPVAERAEEPAWSP